jgi:hypothetical protein
MRKSIFFLFLLPFLCQAQTHGNSTSSNTTTSFGDLAGISGLNNTFFGYFAGQNSSSSSYNNVFIGYKAGLNNQSFYGVFIGADAGTNNTSGELNTFVGTLASQNNTTGKWNSSFGHKASRNNVSGNGNTSIGVHALHDNIQGSDNVSLGLFSGLLNTSGSKNTYLGTKAGFNNLGSSNIFIGYDAGANETGSNQLYIDNSNTSTPLIHGDFNADELVINGDLGIGTDSFTDGTDVYRLSIDGKMRAHGVKVYTDWADFVFEDDYKLPTLKEVEQFINKNGHLKNIPSANEVEKHCIELGEINKLLLQKIEELTLYTIQLKKEIDSLKQIKN